MTAMRERVGGLGGVARFDSAPKGGTTVSVDVPLAAVKAERAARVAAIEGDVR